MSPTQKNNPNLHMLSSRFGSLIFPDQNQTKKNVISKQKNLKCNKLLNKKLFLLKRTKFNYRLLLKTQHLKILNIFIKSKFFFTCLS